MGTSLPLRAGRATFLSGQPGDAPEAFGLAIRWSDDALRVDHGPIGKDVRRCGGAGDASLLPAGLECVCLADLILVRLKKFRGRAAQFRVE